MTLSKHSPRTRLRIRWDEVGYTVGICAAVVLGILVFTSETPADTVPRSEAAMLTCVHGNTTYNVARGVDLDLARDYAEVTCNKHRAHDPQSFDRDYSPKGD